MQSSDKARIKAAEKRVNAAANKLHSVEADLMRLLTELGETRATAAFKALGISARISWDANGPCDDGYLRDVKC